MNQHAVEHPKNYIGLKAWGFGFDAHMTLLYTGNLTSSEEKTVQDLISRAVTSSFYSVAVRANLDLFGPELNVPVLRMSVMDEIYALREHFISMGVPNLSEYGFNPHITLQFVENQPLVIPSHFRLSHLGLY